MLLCVALLRLCAAQPLRPFSTFGDLARRPCFDQRIKGKSFPHLPPHLRYCPLPPWPFAFFFNSFRLSFGSFFQSRPWLSANFFASAKAFSLATLGSLGFSAISVSIAQPVSSAMLE